MNTTGKVTLSNGVIQYFNTTTGLITKQINNDTNRTTLAFRYTGEELTTVTQTYSASVPAGAAKSTIFNMSTLKTEETYSDGSVYAAGFTYSAIYVDGTGVVIWQSSVSDNKTLLRRTLSDGTVKYYDSYGNVTKQILNDTYKTTLAFTYTSNVLTKVVKTRKTVAVDDPAISITYNLLTMTATEIDADGSYYQSKFTYSPLAENEKGVVVWQATLTGTKILVQRSLSDGTVQYFDTNGNMTRQISNDANKTTLSFTYTNGALTKITQTCGKTPTNGAALSITYDLVKLTLSEKYADGSYYSGNITFAGLSADTTTGFVTPSITIVGNKWLSQRTLANGTLQYFNSNGDITRQITNDANKTTLSFSYTNNALTKITKTYGVNPTDGSAISITYDLVKLIASERYSDASYYSFKFTYAGLNADTTTKVVTPGITMTGNKWLSQRTLSDGTLQYFDANGYITKQVAADANKTTLSFTYANNVLTRVIKTYGVNPTDGSAIRTTFYPGTLTATKQYANGTTEAMKFIYTTVSGGSSDTGNSVLAKWVVGTTEVVTHIFAIKTDNTVPVAQGQTLAVNQDTDLNITLVGTDEESAILTYTIVTQPQHGTIVSDANNAAKFVYTPAAGFSGTDSFTYTVNDGLATSEVAIVSIEIKDTVPPEVTLTSTVLTNSSNYKLTYTVDGVICEENITLSEGVNTIIRDAMDTAGNKTTKTWEITLDTVAPVVSLVSASLTNNPTYALQYSVDGKTVEESVTLASEGNNTITRTIKDAAGNQTVATWSIKLDTIAPAISAVASSSVEATSANISWTTIETATTQIEYGLTTSYGTTTNLLSSLVTQHSQAITGLTAVATYHYRVISKDSAGNISVSDDMTFTTKEASTTIPVANAQTVSMLEDSSQTITLTGTDPSGRPLSYVVVNNPTKGILTAVDGDASKYIYTPLSNVAGSDEFTFRTVTSDGVYSELAKVTLKISKVTDLPIAFSQIVDVKNTTTVILGGRTPDSETLTYTLVSQPAHGTLTATSTANIYIYTPVAGYVGTDTFQFKIKDNTEYSAAATVLLRVNAPTVLNTVPTCSAYVFNNADNTRTISIDTKDAEQSASSMVYTVTTAPTKGTVVQDATDRSKWIYTPGTSFDSAGDTVTFSVSDGIGQASPVIVFVGSANSSVVVSDDGGQIDFSKFTAGTQFVISGTVGSNCGTFTSVDGSTSKYYFTPSWSIYWEGMTDRTVTIKYTSDVDPATVHSIDLRINYIDDPAVVSPVKDMVWTTGVPLNFGVFATDLDTANVGIYVTGTTSSGSDISSQLNWSDFYASPTTNIYQQEIWTPTKTGTYILTVHSGDSSQTFNVIVKSLATTQTTVPVFTAPSDVLVYGSGNHQRKLVTNISAVDEGGKDVVVSMTSVKKDGVDYTASITDYYYDNLTGEFFWYPGVDEELGKYEFTFTAIDADGHKSTKTINMTVTLPPVVTGTSEFTAFIKAHENEIHGYSDIVYRNADGWHASVNASYSEQIDVGASASYGLCVCDEGDDVIFTNSSTAYTVAGGDNVTKAMLNNSGKLMTSLYNAFVSKDGCSMAFSPGHVSDGRRDAEFNIGKVAYVYSSMGSSHSEAAAVEAYMKTAGAFKKEVYDYLKENGLLLATIVYLDHWTRMNADPEKYLSRESYPSFNVSAEIDAMAMVKAAYAMTLDTIPSLPQLKMVSQPETGTLGVDYFDSGTRSVLYETPLSIATIYYEHTATKVFELDASSSISAAGTNIVEYNWVVAQGDASKVRIIKLNESGSKVRIEIDYSGSTTVASSGYGDDIISNLTAIALYTKTDKGVYSIPAYFSSYTIPNEQRTYDTNGKILGITYTTAECPRGVGFQKSWTKDVYNYDDNGNLLGWTRYYKGVKEYYGANGMVIVSKDSLGRLVTGNAVTYKIVSSVMTPTVVTSILYKYTYASDTDFTGRLSEFQYDCVGTSGTSYSVQNITVYDADGTLTEIWQYIGGTLKSKIKVTSTATNFYNASGTLLSTATAAGYLVPNFYNIMQWWLTLMKL